MGRDMAREIHRLNTLTINRTMARGYYSDGGGLYLQVSVAGSKSWIYRYTSGDRTRDMGLGSLNDFGLAEARQRAQECRQQRAIGIDPIEARDAIAARLKADAAKAATFKDCAEKYMAAHEPSWKNEKHRDQWHSTLENYAYPVIGALSVGSIGTAHVMKVLEQPVSAKSGKVLGSLWSVFPETAARLRGRVESIIDWAGARGLRHGENPARWKGHLDQLLAAPRKLRRVRHHPAMPFVDLPLFMIDLRAANGIAHRALEFTILTVLRTSEVLGARWLEFNFVDKTWNVPGTRMKGGRDHRVPLSDRALEILSELPRENDLVFPGRRAGRPLSNMAMLKVLDRMGCGEFTTHGFRSTFRDWAGERTNFQNHVVEMALAHAIGDKVEAAYRRGDLFEKRRRLMGAWAAFCKNAVEKSAVLQLKSA